ncbi:putative alba domain containing protein [Golovinomyces cichoracearum]|uniref:Putative alba domain containing protein n=1 Tax=Golovinomyces cichoracearum TaxID=62708 RepID=A0A420IS80_9PEZI|nr:putative alba domain containing protein [Golovinomyces cichoracearum]
MMVDQLKTENSSSSDSKCTHPKKLSRLTSAQKISKRPLLHPAIVSRSSSSGAPRVIYVSTKSSFVGTIKRVRLLLDQIRRHSQGDKFKSLLRQDPCDVQKALSKAVIEEKNRVKDTMNEEVVIKASGKAIDKGLRLASWCSSLDNVKTELRTGSVGAVDDIVDKDGVEEGSRLRNVSFLEVVLTLT